jgi:3-hydroxyisobutyrate dehydrogenase
MKIGFVGLGNVGSKLAGSLLRNGYEVMVRDLNDEFVANFVALGAKSADSAKQLAQASDLIITCLPSPAACSAVMEGSADDPGIIAGLSAGKIWLEMSTTDESEIRRMGALVKAMGAEAVDCPVSGGCHRADTGNISIFAGCSRAAFERALPVLTTLGRRVLHTGELGTASKLKVVTNYLATAHLVALGEALTACKVMGLDMNVSYEAIKASSGNSFVHETESQIILNGSREINFTVDLVLKDVGLFHTLTQREGMKLDLAPLLVDIFTQAQAEWGPREKSPNIIRRYEEPMGVKVLGHGFPADLVDEEAEEAGYELMVPGRQDS